MALIKNEKPQPRESLSFAQLKEMNDIVDIISKYVQIERRGGEFVGYCPWHEEENPSLMVNQKKQVFACFPCSKSGDVVDFLREMGLDTPEVNRVLLGDHVPGEPVRKRVVKKSTGPIWRQITPDPGVKSVFNHPSRGMPKSVWVYLTPEGEKLGFVCRFEEDGRKVTLPLTYCTNGEVCEWRWQAFDEPRPLYGLKSITAMDSPTVIVSEGEKSATAGSLLIDSSPSITWPGGSNAYRKADWSPVYGKNIIMLPDNDEPGVKCAMGIKEMLQDHCPVIRFIAIPYKAEKGFDFADWKMDRQGMRHYIKNNLHEWPTCRVEIKR